MVPVRADSFVLQPRFCLDCFGSRIKKQNCVESSEECGTQSCVHCSKVVQAVLVNLHVIQGCPSTVGSCPSKSKCHPKQCKSCPRLSKSIQKMQMACKSFSRLSEAVHINSMFVQGCPSPVQGCPTHSEGCSRSQSECHLRLSKSCWKSHKSVEALPKVVQVNSKVVQGFLNPVQLWPGCPKLSKSCPILSKSIAALSETVQALSKHGKVTMHGALMLLCQCDTKTGILPVPAHWWCGCISCQLCPIQSQGCPKISSKCLPVNSGKGNCIHASADTNLRKGAQSNQLKNCNLTPFVVTHQKSPTLFESISRLSEAVQVLSKPMQRLPWLSKSSPTRSWKNHFVCFFVMSLFRD